MTKPANAERLMSAARTRTLAGLLLLLGLAVRLGGIGRQALWYDELFSATEASVPLVDVADAVGRFDMHPPLYYLQLSAWETLGYGDIWLRLNSILWWLLAGISLC